MVPHSGRVKAGAPDRNCACRMAKPWQSPARRLWRSTGTEAPGLAQFSGASALKAGKEIEPALSDGRDIKSCDRAPRLPGVSIAEIGAESMASSAVVMAVTSSAGASMP